uniref:Replication factor A C-terminal domain-containing protein n=1 Tax=Tanacetum cinerariifolium TaxID=118510 RepID=A0A699HAX0_TANCI|nr:hypothetical protein [Tanacetum cinerariifolium]
MSKLVSVSSNQTGVLLNQLELGDTGTIMVMMCRMWDVNSATGQYLSTDFIVYDIKGNLMHCIARGNIAHNFLRLKEGSIYSVKNFLVHVNKEEFRVMRYADFMLEFDGDTTIQKASVKPEGFNQIAQQRTYSKILDFYLANRRLYLSSISSTLIIEDEKIYVLKQLKTDDSGVELTKEMLLADNTTPKAGTPENLLMWARNKKYDSSTFHCEVRINKVRTKKGWNYPSCRGEKCKKGNISHKAGQFWCDSCESPMEYPVVRYRLELEISDDTTEVVVVMFDEIATTTNWGLQDGEEHLGLPPALENIVGTSRTLELKSHTYYEHGNYESFTCWKVVIAEDVEGSASSGMVAAKADSKVPVLGALSADPLVATPSKSSEDKKHRRGGQDSDVEESFVADSQPTGGEVGCSSGARKNRRVHRSLRVMKEPVTEAPCYDDLELMYSIESDPTREKKKVVEETTFHDSNKLDFGLGSGAYGEDGNSNGIGYFNGPIVQKIYDKREKSEKIVTDEYMRGMKLVEYLEDKTYCKQLGLSNSIKWATIGSRHQSHVVGWGLSLEYPRPFIEGFCLSLQCLLPRRTWHPRIT